MNYFVKHEDQTLGPFTLAQLQQQLDSGAITSVDLAQSEGMTDWVQVSQILGNIPIPVSTGYGSAAAMAPTPQVVTVPLPYNLHWGVLLLIEIFTRNLFNLIWALYLANWARKLDGQSKHLVLIAMYPAGIVAGIVAMGNQSSAMGGILIFGGLIAYLFGIFSIRSAMEEYYNSVENCGLILGGAMTFFFSTIYLQYHINKIAKWKKTGVMS